MIFGIYHIYIGIGGFYRVGFCQSVLLSPYHFIAMHQYEQYEEQKEFAVIHIYITTGHILVIYTLY